MSNNEEQQALRIDEALSKDQKTDKAEDAPYLRMAKALDHHAKMESAKLDPAVKKTQKEHLLQMAANLNEHRVSQEKQTVDRKVNKTKKPWWLWLGGLATVSAAVLMLFVSQTGKLPLNNLAGTGFDRHGINALSLIIPEAHAGDAFSMLVEKRDESGVEVDSAFRIQSVIPVDKQTLAGNLRVIQVKDDMEWPVEFSVDTAGQNEYMVKPNESLEKGGIYKIVIATAVRDEKGEFRQRNFSWAIQTKDVFKIIKSVPAHGTVNVPLDTAIEITLSQIGWEDPADFVVMDPPVKGRYEMHGRSLVFLPDQKLSPDTLYSVTYKKGWGLPDNGLKLEKDFTFKFQTGETGEDARNSILLSGYLINSSPGVDPLVSLWATDEESPVEITGYEMSYTDALSAMKEIEKYPYWVDWNRGISKIIAGYAKNQVVQYTANIEESDNWNKMLRLPNSLDKGIYAIRLKQNNAEPAWVILQITNLSAYTIADRDKILTWVINTETGRPLSNLKIKASGRSAATDDQGLAYLDTPSSWQLDGDEEREAVVLEYGEGPLGLISVVKYREGGMWRFADANSDNKQAFNTWAYLYSDRPLYRPQDEINFFGLLQDRTTGQGAGQAVVEMRSYGFLDFGTYEEKVYAKAEIDTDASGFFTGKIQWKGELAPGNYNLILKRDGREVLLRSVEIRDIVKPAYYIDIKPEADYLYAGQEVSGLVTVKFYDGTPVVKSRVTLETYGGFASHQSLEVVTDGLGQARFKFATQVPDCDLSGRYVYCSNQESMDIEARPSLGEEGEIRGNARVSVWRGRSNLAVEQTDHKDGQAVIEYRVREVSLDLNDGRENDSVLGRGLSGRLIKARVMEQHWDKRQIGTYFDPIERKTVARYDYVLREVEAGSYDIRTNDDGRASFEFAMKEDIAYRVLASTRDESGAVYAVTSYVSRGWFDRSSGDLPTLENLNLQDSKYAYREGEKISIGFMQNGQKLTADKSAFLFIHASRGLRKTVFSLEPVYDFVYGQDDVPNVSVYGIAFINNGFIQTQFDASLDTEDKELQVIVEPEKENYAPGSRAAYKVKVLSKEGGPVADARVAVSVTDEALLSLHAGYYDENPLGTIYRWLSDGIVATETSHNFMGAAMMGPGGAEMGGGGRGAAALRKNFKDQAEFTVLRTAADGTVSGSFVLPDNITGWRITVVAVSPDLRAGNARSRVSATKDLFVEAVIPQDVLISDKPVIKIRAFGTALKEGENIKYSIDIPSLGINNQTIDGQADKPVYLGVDNLTPGRHKAVISISAGGNVKDAIERTLNIVSSRSTHDQRIEMEVAPGAVLGEVGLNAEMDLVFESKSRGSARAKLENLANPWSARLESLVAGRLARGLLADYFQLAGEYESDLKMSEYQKTEGGLSILPYASSDAALSSKVAASGIEGYDKSRLANYFWSITDDPKSSREESIYALSGLASLGQPVIQRLTMALEEDDLSWRETLALVRGLDAIGDREAARTAFQKLLTKAVSRDGFLILEVSDRKSEVLEASSEAAAIARSMALPDSEKLMAYVESNWSQDVLTDLDRAMYLQKLVPTLLPVDVQISYAIDAQVFELDLKNITAQSVKLTAEEARNFRVTSVNGPATMSFVKRAEGDKAQVSDVLSVNRVYSGIDGRPINTLTEGDLVRITLTPSWQERAEDGCYILRDRLPAGMMPMLNISFDRYREETLYYPYDFKQGEVSFVTCKQAKPYAISYLARVVSLGTYTAGGALLQSMQAPSVAAVSSPTVLEIK